MTFGVNSIELPKPKITSDISVEEALKKRRSVREYKNIPLTIEDVSPLLWAAQGITSSDGKRTAPSAGALYPLEVYIVVGNVKGLPSGVYKYLIGQHKITQIAKEDFRSKLQAAALNQSCIGKGAIVIALSAIYSRTTKKYKQRGIKYAHIEIGHVVQNIYLQATSLDLGTVVVGAFDDDSVKSIFNMQKEEQPLALMPVGYR